MFKKILFTIRHRDSGLFAAGILFFGELFFMVGRLLLEMKNSFLGVNLSPAI